MSRSRGGGGRGRGGRVLQAQLTRSSLTLLSRFPSSAAPPSPCVPLGESLSLPFSLFLSPPRAAFPPCTPFASRTLFLSLPLLSSELLLFSSGVSVSSRSPSRLLLPPAPPPSPAPGASPQRQHSSSILRSARILTLVSCCLHFAVTFLTLFFAYGRRTREKEKKREK